MEPTTNTEVEAEAEAEVIIIEDAENLSPENNANDSERIRVVHGSGSVVVEEPEKAVDITVHTP